MMRILVLHQGHYGERIFQHIQGAAPEGWVLELITPPRVLPIVIDEPEEFLPSNIPQADLLLAMSESPETAQLVPAIARLSEVRAVIMPVDNSVWLPLGLQNELRCEITGMGVAVVFPRTFCTLTEKTAGYGSDVEYYDSEHIASFAEYFGRPRLKIELDAAGTGITGIKVERSAPCGSTHYVAEKLVGVPVTEAVPQAGLYAHHYPCLASMQMEATGDTLMHISGYVVNDEVEQELKTLS
jgi:hypothetical protein